MKKPKIIQIIRGSGIGYTQFSKRRGEQGKEIFYQRTSLLEIFEGKFKLRYILFFSKHYKLCFYNRKQGTDLKRIVIKDNVWLGANVTVTLGATLEEGSIMVLEL